MELHEFFALFKEELIKDILMCNYPLIIYNILEIIMETIEEDIFLGRKTEYRFMKSYQIGFDLVNKKIFRQNMYQKELKETIVTYLVMIRTWIIKFLLSEKDNLDPLVSIIGSFDRYLIEYDEYIIEKIDHDVINPKSVLKENMYRVFPGYGYKDIDKHTLYYTDIDQFRDANILPLKKNKHNFDFRYDYNGQIRNLCIKTPWLDIKYYKNGSFLFDMRNYHKLKNIINRLYIFASSKFKLNPINEDNHFMNLIMNKEGVIKSEIINYNVNDKYEPVEIFHDCQKNDLDRVIKKGKQGRFLISFYLYNKNGVNYFNIRIHNMEVKFRNQLIDSLLDADEQTNKEYPISIQI